MSLVLLVINVKIIDFKWSNYIINDFGRWILFPWKYISEKSVKCSVSGTPLDTRQELRISHKDVELCKRGEGSLNVKTQGFPNSSNGWGESEILLEWTFLPGGGNLRRSDFDNSNLFQQLSVNTEHQLKPTLAWYVCTKSMKLKKKMVQVEMVTTKNLLSFYWVITWKLLFSGGRN